MKIHTSKHFLVTSTFLLGALSAGSLCNNPASAQTITIDSAVTASQTLLAGESLEVTPSGSISQTNPAVFVGSSVFTAGFIDNSGIISGTNNGINLFNGGITGDLDNQLDATISGGVNGIRLNTYGTISGNLETSGDIIGGVTGVSIATLSSVGNIIVNESGSISGGDYGINIGSSNIAGAITNNGVISGGIASIFANIPGWGGIGSISNQGTLSGDMVLNVLGITGGITNSGTILGDIQLNNLTLATPITLDGGRVIGDITDNVPANGFTNVVIADDFTLEGDISVSDLIVSAGQTLTLDQDHAVILEDMGVSSGVWRFNVDPGNAAARLSVTSGDVDLTGSVVRAGTITGDLSNGDTLMIADGNSTVTGGPGGTPTDIGDDSALWDFQIVDGTFGAIGGDDSELYMVASGGDITTITSGSNADSLGNVLNSLGTSSSADILDVINRIDNASTGQEIRNIVDSLYVPPNRAGAISALQFKGIVGSTINSRLNSKRTGLSAGDSTYNPLAEKLSSLINSFEQAASEGFGVWVQAYGARMDQGFYENVAGYDADMSGFALGVDTDNRDLNMVVGLSYGYADVDIASKDINNTTIDIGAHQFTIYGDYDLDNDIYAKGTLGYTYSNNETQRNNVGLFAGRTAYGDYSSHLGFISGEVGFDYLSKKKDNLTFTPAVTAFYGRYKASDYVESGAGDLNLEVEQDSLNVFELGAKLDATWEYTVKDQGILQPTAESLGGSSRLIGDGASFVTKGFSPPRHSVDMGVGFTYTHVNNLHVQGGYSVEVKEDYKAHSALVKVSALSTG
jgi:hypothetical protein